MMKRSYTIQVAAFPFLVSETIDIETKDAAAVHPSIHEVALVLGYVSKAIKDAARELKHQEEVVAGVADEG